MAVAVDETGQHRAPVEIDHARALALQREDIRQCSHGDDLAVAHRDGLGAGLCVVDGQVRTTRIDRVRHVLREDKDRQGGESGGEGERFHGVSRIRCRQCESAPSRALGATPQNGCLRYRQRAALRRTSSSIHSL